MFESIGTPKVGSVFAAVLPVIATSELSNSGKTLNQGIRGFNGPIAAKKSPIDSLVGRPQTWQRSKR